MDGQYLTICDRSKDIVIHKGCNVNSKELEDIVNTIDTVVNCIVVGELNEKYGELPVAVCTGKINGNDILSKVNTKVSKYKRLWKV